jgi:hypothetical protein
MDEQTLNTFSESDPLKEIFSQILEVWNKSPFLIKGPLTHAFLLIRIGSQ